MNHSSRMLLIVLLYATACRLVTLDRPFAFDSEATGLAYGVFARNYLHFGLVQTRGIPVLTVGQPPPGTPIAYYPNHPPLVPLLIAGVYLLFGIGEWQTRLPTSIATVTAIYALYRLVQGQASSRAALIAAALFAAMPMTLYYGGLPEVVGMPLVLFALISVSVYLSFHNGPSPWRALWLIVAFTAAAVSDWPAFILVPVFLVHFLATRERNYWPWIVGFCAATSAIFGLLYVYIAAAAHLRWTWMVPLFRSHSAIWMTPPFTARQWLATAIEFNRLMHTLPVLVASGLWLLTSTAYRRHVGRGATVARILIAWGVLHVLIGRKGVFVHEWWWSPLTPGLAVTAGLLIDALIVAFEYRSLGRAATRTAALGIMMFAAWTSITTFDRLFPRGGRVDFTTRELGEAIRAAAPQPNDLALLVWSGVDPQLWFYGNRPLRGNVWSIAEFEQRLRDQTADLVYGDEQPWTEPATGIVFPVRYRDDLNDLRTYLEEHYPLIPVPANLVGKFDVFDLRNHKMQ